MAAAVSPCRQGHQLAAAPADQQPGLFQPVQTRAHEGFRRGAEAAAASAISAAVTGLHHEVPGSLVSLADPIAGPPGIIREVRLPDLLLPEASACPLHGIAPEAPSVIVTEPRDKQLQQRVVATAASVSVEHDQQPPAECHDSERQHRNAMAVLTAELDERHGRAAAARVQEVAELSLALLKSAEEQVVLRDRQLDALAREQEQERAAHAEALRRQDERSAGVAQELEALRQQDERRGEALRQQARLHAGVVQEVEARLRAEVTSAGAAAEAAARQQQRQFIEALEAQHAQELSVLEARHAHTRREALEDQAREHQSELEKELTKVGERSHGVPHQLAGTSVCVCLGGGSLLNW